MQHDEKMTSKADISFPQFGLGTQFFYVHHSKLHNFVRPSYISGIEIVTLVHCADALYLASVDFDQKIARGPR
jgi:hypothetical protein